MDFIEPCFGIGHNLSLICQMTSEDIKHQLIIIIIQDKISICPTRKLSIWRAVLKERYVPSVPNNQKLQCTWRDQNKQRKPISTDVNDTLDDCYNDVPDDLLVSIVQISAGKSKVLTLTLYYTPGTITLQAGRAASGWTRSSSHTDSPSTPSTSCGCRL